MGKLIQFSRTRRHKIVLGVCIGMATLFMIIGIVLSITLGTSSASAITVNASGAEQQGTRYIIPVFSRHTPITINTDPVGAPLQMQFIRGDGFVSVPNQTFGGAEVVLTLPATPTFFDPADQSTWIEIVVTSPGGPSIVLDVRITLDPSQVVMSTRIERRESANAPWFTVNSVSFSDYRAAQFLSDVRMQSMYRVVSTFSVMGSEMFNTLDTAGRARFSDVELTLHHQTGIRLFSHILGTNFLHLPDGSFANETFHFAVNVDFGGQTFTDFFSLHVGL